MKELQRKQRSEKKRAKHRKGKAAALREPRGKVDASFEASTHDNDETAR
jgi:hypothetical protein